MRRRFALAVVGLVLATSACQRGRETRAPVPTPVVDHAEEARTAIAAQNWGVAAEHLRVALQQKPESLFLHYNLAICATWLELRNEAVREFEWVVAHAPLESEESKAARRWLADTTQTTPGVQRTAAAVASAGDGRIHGTTTWAAEPGQNPRLQPRLQLFLMGLRDTPTKGFHRVLRSDREGRYEFTGLTAGSYKLTDAIAGRPKWRLKVTLEPGQTLMLDLSPQNGASVRDDFPEG